MTWINEAGWDRALRILAGAAMLLLGWMGFVGGTAGVVLRWFGFVPLLTGLVGWCPLYALVGMNTRRAMPGQRSV